MRPNLDVTATSNSTKPEREGELYQEEGDLEVGEEAEAGVEEGDGVEDLDGLAAIGAAAEEDAVDGGGLVFQGVEDELYVGVLSDLVPQLAACHGSDDRRRRRERRGERERRAVDDGSDAQWRKPKSSLTSEQRARQLFPSFFLFRK